LSFNLGGQMSSHLASSASGEIVVSCRGVAKSYGSGEAKVAALRGIDLDVRRGELFMIVGPSGCGKTTLISVITTILNHDAGECRVLGRDVQRMGEQERALFRSKSIGFVFQLFNLLPALTAAENVAIPLLIEGAPWERAKTCANDLLGRIGLGARADTLPANLSGGQQQRVAIARAVVHDPPLLVCDEPTSNLDHETGHAVMEVLRSLARNSDRTVIVVTHDPRIFEFADRIARMDDGRITEILEGRDRERLQ
jgi:putative ABC transport system ATP-binding protein